MNNKRIGIAFERKMCNYLAEKGYWVHFISPDVRGAQPFDLIFVKNSRAYVADCKTCKDHIFRYSRLEDNQILAFRKWMKCGNSLPMIFVLHDGAIYRLWYNDLERDKKIDLRERTPICILE